MKKRQFKIDEDTSSWFRYAVYEKSFGIWWKVFSTDRLACAKEYIAQALQLPIYITEGDEL